MPKTKLLNFLPEDMASTFAISNRMPTISAGYRKRHFFSFKVPIRLTASFNRWLATGDTISSRSYRAREGGYAIDVEPHCIAPFSQTRTISYLQSDANTVQDWVNCNHMSLNPPKCKFMLIPRKRNRMNNSPTITINGQILESVPTFKYLGLLLTSDLSWSREHAPRQRKSWAYTVDSISTLTRILFTNYIPYSRKIWRRI